MVWLKMQISVSQCLITDALYCHTKVCGLFCFSQGKLHGVAYLPCCLAHQNLQRQRSLHCALIHVPITSGFDAQCPVGLGNLASKESIPSNAYYTNTVLFIF